MTPHRIETGLDEVDRIVAAWHARRPVLDPAPLHVFSRLDRLSHHLDRARRSTFADHGLEGWEFDVLAALRRAGEPLTPGRLMAETLVSSGTMTNRIDRMVSHGLVEREADPHDRRMVRVFLTDRGLARVDAAMAALLAQEQEWLDSLAPADRDQLAHLLRTLLHRFEG